MNRCLGKLVKNLPNDEFWLLLNHFERKTPDHNYLLGKNFYPNSDMGDFEKFDERALPRMGVV